MNIKKKSTKVIALAIAMLTGWAVASAQAASEMSAKERNRAIGKKDGRTAEEVIASIDSSKWAVNPLKFGMSAMDYERAEAELLFGNFAKRAGGVNKFFHFPGLTKADDRWVVSVNNDTIYSVATVDARKGFSVTVPDVGERFLSIHIQDFNHTIVDYTWSPGTHEYPAGTVDTDYVLVGIRTATDGSEADQAYVREQLELKFKFEAGSAIILLAAGGKVAPTPDAQKALATIFDSRTSEADYLDAMQHMVGDPADKALSGEALKQSRAPNAGPIQRTAGMSAKLTDWWAPAGQVPFLILQGENDQAAPPQNGQMLKADLGDRATLVNIPSAGHLMVVTKPDVVSKEIVRFIRQSANAGK